MKAEQSCGIKPKILNMFFCLTWPVIRLDHLGASFSVLDVSVKYNVIKSHSSYCAQSTENTLKNATACLQFLCPQILDPLTQKHSSTHKTLVHRHLKCNTKLISEYVALDSFCGIIWFKGSFLLIS